MYKEKTVNGFLVGESEVLKTDHANQVPGPRIAADLGGCKVPVGIEIVKAANEDAAKLLLEVSFDGENFSEPVTLIKDIKATKKGVKVALADLRDIKAPFYRLSLGGVTKLGDKGEFRLFYSASIDDLG